MPHPPLLDSQPFLRSWVRDPVAVGLPFVSSLWTARRLAEVTLRLASPSAGPILELGAGTGAVTEALLCAGCSPDNAIAVERDPELCRSLAHRFPGLRVLQGDALKLGAVLAQAGISSVGVVLSGLPMRAVPAAKAARCYADAFARMPPDGAIVQYTYGLRPPVDPRAADLKLEAKFVGREWRNLPPVAIWSYRRSESPHAKRVGT